MISYITCGIRTGCVLGHLSPASPFEPGEYATCDLWSGESSVTPSQHEGKITVARIPPGHGVEGKLEVSLALQGAPEPPMMRSSACRQRWQMPGDVPFLLRLLGSPASMRKPYHSQKRYIQRKTVLGSRASWLWCSYWCHQRGACNIQ
jgi:hypothetical protein